MGIDAEAQSISGSIHRHDSLTEDAKTPETFSNAYEGDSKEKEEISLSCISSESFFQPFLNHSPTVHEGHIDCLVNLCTINFAL